MSNYGFGRINDMCHEAAETAKAKGFNGDIVNKMEKNATRPHKHGGKRT